MIDARKLYLEIVSNGMTQKDVATEIGMTPKTFYTKMKRGVFESDEIEAMITLLAIENPMQIFFPAFVTRCVTKREEPAADKSA